MKHLFRLVATSLCAALSAACASPSPSAFVVRAPQAQAHQGAIGLGSRAESSQHSKARTFLYAANSSSISVYAPGGTIPIRTITDGIASPSALAFDYFGNLYVANSAKGANTVAVYKPGSSALLRTIAVGVNRPFDLAFSPAGNLFVSNNLGLVGRRNVPGSVTVYAPGKSTPLRTITDGIITPHGIAFDKSGDLYVANCCHNVQVYAPGGTSPLRTDAYLAFPQRMAFDPYGYLFVANSGGNYYCPGFVAMYAPQAIKPQLYIQTGYSCGPFGTLAIDRVGNVYVPSMSSNDVDVFRARSNSRLYTITGINSPEDLKFDSNGLLYVANNGSVTVYAFGRKKPLRTITSGITGQVLALALGSQ